MNDDPKPLADLPLLDDPALPTQLRADLRIARDAPAGYDVDRGLARLSAAILAGPPGPGTDPGGGGGQPGDGGSGAGASGVAGTGAAAAGGVAGVKAVIAGLVALGALGGAIAVGPATRSPPPAPAAATSATARLIAPVAPSPVASSPREPVSAEPPSVGSAAPAASGSPHVSASAAPASSTLKPEMEQLAEGRRALAADPARALALAEEGHARFPRGVFGQEREALAITALAKLGRSAEARARARRFVEKHPESPIAEGLRPFVEGESRD